MVLPESLIIKISPTGMENGLRNKKDGYVYFGADNDEEFVSMIPNLKACQ
jgi:hypothetical protein